MYPISVDKQNLVVHLSKERWELEDINIFRQYGFRWSPDGKIAIQIRGTTKKALYNTILTLYPEIKRTWDKTFVDNFWKQIREAYEYFEKGFDNAVVGKCPIYKGLYAHQKEGVRALCYKQYTLLSFEQGLGKSMTALIPSLILNTPLTLIIVPNSLKYNWREEMTETWQKNFGHSVPVEQITILQAGNKSIFATDEKYIIVNYDMVEKFYDYIIQKSPSRIIIDECHYIKNPVAKRTKTIKNLIFKLNSVKKCSVSFLSGTPAPNKIVDMYSYLEMAKHPHGANYRTFLSKFCFTEKTRFGVKVTEGKNIKMLSRDLSNIMIRKLKSECLDLPPKRYIKIDFENEEYDLQYQEAYNELIKQIAASNGKRSVDSLSCLNVLQIITAKAKVKPCIELAEQIISDVTIGKDGTERKKKVAIMCNFKEPLKILANHFKDKCIMIDGSVDAEKRMELVNAFRKIDDIQVFIGQTTAVGVGLNLTECSDVIFLNFPYTRAEIEQAADRFHRIGQNNSVNVYFTVLVGKIDQLIYKIVVSKYKDISQLIDNVVDNTETINVGDEIIDLFSEISKEIQMKAA